MAAVDTGTLVEREEAASAVDEVLTSAGRREGSVALIEATAGMGRTALLSSARERAASAGLFVAAALGAELERDFSFGIVRQLFERTVAAASPTERHELLSGSARLAALCRARGGDGALEELAHDAKREVPLKLRSERRRDE